MGQCKWSLQHIYKIERRFVISLPINNVVENILDYTNYSKTIECMHNTIFYLIVIIFLYFEGLSSPKTRCKIENQNLLFVIRL